MHIILNNTRARTKTIVIVSVECCYYLDALKYPLSKLCVCQNCSDL